MRRFRFVGNPDHYNWDNGPLVDNEYDGDYVGVMEKFSWESMPLEKWCSEFPEDWQEVFEEPQVFNRVGFNEKPLHKDTDLGHFAGLALMGLVNANHHPDGYWVLSREVLAKEAIEQAKELIKQLDQETK